MGRLRQTSYRKRRIYEFDERSRSQYPARCCRCWCIGWFRCCQEVVHQHENFCLKIYSLKTYIFRVCRQYCSELVLCINIITSNPLITHTLHTSNLFIVSTNRRLVLFRRSFLLFVPPSSSIWTFVWVRVYFIKIYIF